MEEIIGQRFKTLLEEGEYLVDTLPHSKHGNIERTVNRKDIPRYQTWLGSAINLIKNLVPPENYLFTACEEVMNHRYIETSVPTVVVLKIYGLLESTKQEWERGLLRRVEYIITALNFDDFLDHAESYHKGNRVTEASVLASAVLEDTVKKIARKNNLNPSGQSLDELIDALTKANVFTPVKAKRVKGYAGVRNSALHAEWDQIDIRDVGGLIKGTRELIDRFL